MVHALEAGTPNLKPKTYNSTWLQFRDGKAVDHAMVMFLTGF
jgi:hypothetical protein